MASRSSRTPRWSGSSSRLTELSGSSTGSTDELRELRADVVVNAAGMWGRELGADGRRHGAAARGRALLHRHRVGRRRLSDACPCFATRTAAATSRRNRASCSSDGSSRSPSRGACSRRRSGSGIPESFSFGTLPADLDHIAPLLEAAAHRMPLLERDGHPAVLQRPRVVHAGRPLPARRDPRRHGSVRRVRLQLDRHPVVRRRRQGAGGLDRRRSSADGPVGRRHPTDDAVPGQRQLPARPHGRDARAAVRHALALPTAGDGSRRPALGAARPAGRAGCLLR